MVNQMFEQSLWCILMQLCLLIVFDIVEQEMKFVVVEIKAVYIIECLMKKRKFSVQVWSKSNNDTLQFICRNSVGRRHRHGW